MWSSWWFIPLLGLGYLASYVGGIELLRWMFNS